jgi:peroxiredoxin
VAVASLIVVLMAVLLAVATPGAAGDGVEVGQRAPGFTLTGDDGTQVSLSDASGKVVVLEWINPDCPFVKRHYEAGTMKALAERYAGKGVVWLAINSTHYMSAEDGKKMRSAHELPYPILDDHDGTVGRSYGAATTPHMFIIDAEGTVVYEGAIDDDPRGRKGEEATSYVAAALDALLAGQAVEPSRTKPYGCSVKYKK